MKKLLLAVLASAVACTEIVAPEDRSIVLSTVIETPDIVGGQAHEMVPSGKIPTTPDNLPSVTCNLRENMDSRVWLVISDGTNPLAPWCTIQVYEGEWWVSIHYAPIGWVVDWVVTY